jgi:hypothetical protein
MIEKQATSPEDQQISLKNRLFDWIKEQLKKPNVFFAVALTELFFLFLVCGIIVYCVSNL